MIEKTHFVVRAFTPLSGAGTSLKRALLLVSAVVGISIVVGACGGSSDSASGNSSGGASASGGTQLNLVAYSTPKAAYAALISAFEKTSAG